MMYHRRVGLQGIPKPSNPSRGIRRVFPSHPSPSPRSGRAQLGESHLAGEEHIWAGQPLAGPGSAASLHGSARCSSGITGTGAKRAVPEPFRCSERRRDFTVRGAGTPGFGEGVGWGQREAEPRAARQRGVGGLGRGGCFWLGCPQRCIGRILPHSLPHSGSTVCPISSLDPCPIAASLLTL